MPTDTYVNARGDFVPWEALDWAEQAFYSTPAPWEIAEYGLSIRQFVLKWHADAAMHELYFEDASLIPD